MAENVIREKGPARYAIVKGIIARAHKRGDGECEVVFIKKNGDTRYLLFSPALADNYVSDMSEKGFNRKSLNPNLVNLVDLPIYQDKLDKGNDNQQAIRNAFKSLNMDTLLFLKTNEGEWVFEDEVFDPTPLRMKFAEDNRPGGKKRKKREVKE